MVVTLDPPDSLRQLIYDNWNLHGSLSKATIGPEGFNTGIPAPSRRYPSVECIPVPTTRIVRTTEWWEVDAVVNVHIWERPRTTEKDALTKAKNNRRYLVQEVLRILHNKQIQAIDIQWLSVDVEICADQYHALEEPEESSRPVQKGFFPILHTIIPVRCKQWHSALVGGMAVNRPAT